MGGFAWQPHELQVLQRLKEGLSIQDVAFLLPNRTKKAIHLKAFKMGLCPEMSYWTEEEDNFILQNYPRLTAGQIAAALGTRTKLSVRQRIAKLGISQEQWACKHSANEDFFKTPNPLNCYWAGFIAADGCVHEAKACKTKILTISITASDRLLLERFAQDTKFTGDVRVDSKGKSETIINGRKVTTNPTVSISISCCQNWFDDLFKYWKITPRKSLTLEPPENLDYECSLAYIKGFLDGDGCAHFRKKDGSFQMHFYGTEAVLLWIKAFFDQYSPHYTDEWRTKKRCNAEIQQAGKIYHYTVGEYRSLHIAREILNLDLPELPRKWDRIRQYIAKVDKEFEERRHFTEVYVFDKSRVYLGRLCKRGHDYLGTGKSLRRVGHGSCIRCSQENQGVQKPLVPISYWLEKTKQEHPEIDNNKFYLGTFCEKNHEYQDTGLSLRYLSSRQCLQCSKEQLDERLAAIRAARPPKLSDKELFEQKLELTKQLAPEIDINIFYLGGLCHREHEYKFTKMSLRRVVGKDCEECKKQRYLEAVGNREFKSLQEAGTFEKRSQASKERWKDQNRVKRKAIALTETLASHSMPLLFVSPSGESYITDSISQFAKKFDLRQSGLSSVLSGKKKSCLGWTGNRLESWTDTPTDATYVLWGKHPEILVE